MRLSRSRKQSPFI
ncbi:hypothetical protein V2J09_009037 [Rumex salicifolius]